MFVNPYHIHIHQVDYEDEKNFINCRHRSLSMQCIQQFYAVFSTSKSVQKPPKTKQKQSSICILTVESRPIYAKLKFGSIWHDGRTNKRGGGGLDTQPILVYFLLRLPEDRSIPSVTTTQHPEIASVDTDTILKTKKKDWYIVLSNI